MLLLLCDTAVWCCCGRCVACDAIAGVGVDVVVADVLCCCCFHIWEMQMLLIWSLVSVALYVDGAAAHDADVYTVCGCAVVVVVGCSC